MGSSAASICLCACSRTLHSTEPQIWTSLLPVGMTCCLLLCLLAAQASLAPHGLQACMCVQAGLVLAS